MRGKIKLVKVAVDKTCGCITSKQVLGGLEVGGLVLTECAKHKAETDIIHARAFKEYRDGRGDPVPAAPDEGVAGEQEVRA